jgi:hypothetical protein
MLRQFNAFARATELIVDRTWKNLPSRPTFVAPKSWRESRKFHKLCLEKDGEKSSEHHMVVAGFCPH